MEKLYTKHCKCGYDANHMFVSAKRKYTLTGLFLLFCGISAKPIRLEYVCRQCNTKLKESDDPELLAANAYR